jgi:hypothetical protein
MTIRVLWLTAACAAFAGAHAAAQSELEKAFTKRRPGEREEANRPSAPSNAPRELLLTRENGPYLIYIAGYVGDESLKHAVRLTSELREKHRLRAYVFYKEPDVGFHQPTKEDIERMKKQFKGKAPRFPRLLTPPADHWAVVVGDFKTAEDRAFDATMRKLESFRPESFSPEVASELRWGRPQNKKPKDQLVGLRAVPNPLVEKDNRLTKEQIARFKMIKELNDQEGEYCIYRNRAPLTIRVYTFMGAAGLVDTGKKDFLGRSTKKNGLAVAADNARVLCHELRRMGYDSYIFHADQASVVCIGGYPGRFPDQIYDPKLIADLERFKKIQIGPLKMDPDVLPTPQDPAAVLNAN